MDEHKMYNLLFKAQETYGYANQVTVAAEECLELALLLQKYPRFSTHSDFCEALDKDKGVTMRERVIEETADVVIILHHLYMMFNIQPDEQQKWIDAKLERLERWLKDSSDIQHTTVDREVKLELDKKRECNTCDAHEGDGIISNDTWVNRCSKCVDTFYWKPRSESNDVKGV